MDPSALEYLQIPRGTTSAIRHLVALALVGVGAAVAALLEAHAGLREPAMIFLTSVLVTAVLAGLGPSLLAAATSVLAYDFFFTEPFHTFKVDDPQDIVSIVVFLVVAVLASNLTARIRDQADAAIDREARTAALYAFTRELAAAVRVDDLLAIVVRHVGERFRGDAILLLPEGATLKARAAYPPGASVPDGELEAASFAWAEGRSAPSAILTAAGGSWVHISLGTIRGEIAILSLHVRGAAAFVAGDERLLDAFTQLAGVALERCLAVAGVAADPADGAEGPGMVARAQALEQRIERMSQELLGMKAAAHDLLEASRRVVAG